MESATPTLPSRIENFAVILFGLECLTTRIVLQELIEAGIAVNLVCLPGRRSIPLHKTGRRRTLPMVSASTPQTVATLATSAGIDVWRIGDLDADSVQGELTGVPADLLIVACYNRLIPNTIYASRRYGGLNLHPSLLPDKRGPDPLFWVFRQGDRQVGSTVHRLTDSFDAGEILAQASMPTPEGISESELDAILSGQGARLVVQTVNRLNTKSIVPIEQNEAAPTWAPHPSADDFQLSIDWTAHRAANFYHGVRARGHPILVDVDGQIRRIVDVRGWTVAAAGPPTVSEDVSIIRFADGWLVATLAGDDE